MLAPRVVDPENATWEHRAGRVFTVLAEGCQVSGSVRQRERGAWSWRSAPDEAAARRRIGLPDCKEPIGLEPARRDGDEIMEGRTHVHGLQRAIRSGRVPRY